MRRSAHARWTQSTTAAVVTQLREEGPRGLAYRVIRRAYQRLDVGALDFTLLPADVADSSSLGLRLPERVTEDRPLRIGWLCTPPAAGSGGHTTMFRMVRVLEEAGHECEIVLYDRHAGRTEAQAAVIRESWPWIFAGIRSIRDGLDGLDVVVATGWESAHVLASRTEDVVHRAYFIQDFEPLF